MKNFLAIGMPTKNFTEVLNWSSESSNSDVFDGFIKRTLSWESPNPIPIHGLLNGVASGSLSIGNRSTAKKLIADDLPPEDDALKVSMSNVVTPAKGLNWGVNALVDIWNWMPDAPAPKNFRLLALIRVDVRRLSA